MNIKKSIAMPNEIFSDMKRWLSEGGIKSTHHQEFIYCYYWYIAYLWRYTEYQNPIYQSDIKKFLGYNPKEQRVDYIIKKNGLLDKHEYTETTSNLPVLWNQKGNDSLSFDMLYDFKKGIRDNILKNHTNRYQVKRPIKHIGNSEGGEDGIFWSVANTHMMTYEILELCLSHQELGCAGFYLYGILTFIRDKSLTSVFSCSNDTLITYTGWSLNKVYKMSSDLQKRGLIDKSQPIRKEGSTNSYRLLYSNS